MGAMQVLEAFFGDKGLKYSQGRLTIGSCDFSVGSYCYNDVEGDYAMEHFSIQHDREVGPVVFLVVNMRASLDDSPPHRAVLVGTDL